MIEQKLNKLELPKVMVFNNGRPVEKLEQWQQRRTEIIDLLAREVYGLSPIAPDKVIADVVERNDMAFAGKAIHSLLHIKFDTPKGEFSFPVNLIVPKSAEPCPLLLHIAFRPDIPDRYYPVEEILDEGFATVSFCYKDVTDDDDDDFSTGLADMYTRNRESKEQWGKISMWAWAAQRVMDYIQTLSEIDPGKVAVVGHSRLGKTALWCAAQDERFAVGISNESGCSGAAITRDKKGERVADIIRRYGYWFCDNYKKYVDNEHNMPFDQHFLLSAIAPRLVYVSSALEDQWSDPDSEFLSCVAASDVYNFLDRKGVIAGSNCLTQTSTKN